MKYIRIDGFHEKISRLVFGTAFISTKNINQYSEVITEYLKLGGNIFDTAENYGRGESEKALGQWLEKNNYRDDVLIISKGGHPYDGKNRITPEAIKDDLLGSLERLRTDYIDIYFLHRDNKDIPVQEIINELNDYYEKGFIRGFGASNWTHERIEEANEYARKNSMKGFICSSPNLSLAKAREPMWPGCVSIKTSDKTWYRNKQFPLFSWSSQAGGFFTGKYNSENKENEDMIRVYYSEENWERYKRAKFLAEEKGCQPVEIALAYVLNQEFPTTGIVGSRTIDELHSNYRALKLELSKEEVKWLNLE